MKRRYNKCTIKSEFEIVVIQDIRLHFMWGFAISIQWTMQTLRLYCTIYWKILSLNLKATFCE